MNSLELIKCVCIRETVVTYAELKRKEHFMIRVNWISGQKK